MDEKIAHLGFIQAVINRMGNNSFLIKGWTVTLVSAIFALSSQKVDTSITYITLVPSFMFWCMDTFFLHQEKMYRKLYEKVADGTVKSDTFIMNAVICKDDVDPIYFVFFSKTLLPFYGFIILIVTILIWSG